MRSLPVRLLEKYLPADVAEYVIGDLVERNVSGIRLWMELVVALWTFRGAPPQGDGVMSSFVADLRHAARLLRRSPGFTIVSIITLALGVGATTAMFSVIQPVLLDPLPYPNAERLVTVWERGRDGSPDNVGFLTYVDLVGKSRTIESAAVIGSWQPVIEGSNGPERIDGDRVSWSYFRTLGVQPMLGRDFASDEDVPGQNTRVILSHALWARSFGSDSAVINRVITINGAQMTVVGVMGPTFHNVISPEAQIWRVIGYGAAQPWACRSCHHLRMVARLHPHMSSDAATADLDQVFHGLLASFPTEYGAVGTLLVPIKQQVIAAYRPGLLALGGAVALMLLIAVANVVSMQLARAARRDEEFAIRTALGASSGRLLRQLLTEGLLLAVLGGIAGGIVAAFALPVLVRQLPVKLPRMNDIRLDLATLAVGATIALAFTVLVGLSAARSRQLSRIAEALRGGRRTATSGRQLARSGMVVTEIALALMLLIGGGLLARTMIGLLAVRPGFDPSGMLTMEINSIGKAYPDNASIFRYHDRVRAEIAALPGVTDVAVANQLPLGGGFDRYNVVADDKPLANPELAPNADRYAVSAAYLRTMRIPIVAGRTFTEAEERDSTNYVALVSVALATSIWGGESPLGKRIRMGGEKAPLRTVIGVTGDVRHQTLDETVSRQFYVPERQWFSSDNQEALIIRTSGNPAAIAPAVRRIISQIDPAQPIVKVATMDDVISASTAQRRVALVLFGTFASTALLLAIAGIYGILSGRVAERTREIGLRTALGATPNDILALIVGQGLRLAIIGLAIGLVGAFSLSHYLQSILFGVGANDPATIGAVVGMMLMTTLAACLIPAMRAARVEASVAIRAD